MLSLILLVIFEQFWLRGPSRNDASKLDPMGFMGQWGSLGFVRSLVKVKKFLLANFASRDHSGVLVQSCAFGTMGLSHKFFSLQVTFSPL